MNKKELELEIARLNGVIDELRNQLAAEKADNHRQTYTPYPQPNRTAPPSLPPEYSPLYEVTCTAGYAKEL